MPRLCNVGAAPDQHGYLHQRIAELERQVAEMTRHRDDIDGVALEAAQRIDDLFAQGHEGGVTQRTARVQIVVRETIRMALSGETLWSTSSEMQQGRTR